MKSYTPPQQVISPKNKWSLIDVLEDNGQGDISIAIGRWDGDLRLAIRWNGVDGESPLGNPQSRGIPTWFIVPPGKYTDSIIENLDSLEKKDLARNFL